MSIIVILLLALFTKHFIIDFPLQWEYQWRNKGTYGHPGGLIHAGLHGIGTYLCFIWLSFDLAIIFAVADAIIHYHIDWAKMRINDHYGWQPNNSAKFWVLLGFDQYLHALTYIAMIGLLV